MLLSQQNILTEAIHDSLNQLNFLMNIEDIHLEKTKHSKYGDVSCNIAMKIAGNKNYPEQNPRNIAQNIIDILKQYKYTHINSENIVEKYEVAGPGFINIFLTQQAKTQVIKAILKEKEQFGHTLRYANQSVILEFVSANPTGPLHVGHGRQAVLGDCLSRLLKTQGYTVHNEFYYNDAGVQIQNLAHSVQMRAKGYTPEDAEWPENAYNGSYINDIAQAFMQKKSVQNTLFGCIQASGDIDNLEDIRTFSVAYLRNEQDIDLKMFDVYFDHYYLESSLYTDGKVKDVIGRLIENKQTYTQTDPEKGEALYLKTTTYGDDKDRVMQKSDGSYTYFVPDIAYHVTKFKRGFNKAINIQGFDHHGTIARVKAGLQALNLDIPKQYPDYILHKMVTVFKNGKEVKISKRAGSYVTLRDLIEWSGQDAANNLNSTNNLENTDSKDIHTMTEHALQKGRDTVRFFLCKILSKI
jgi:arginyl-tRNA synthetase